MHSLPNLLLIAAAIVTGPLEAGSGAQVNVNIQVAVVTVKPLPDGRNLIPLPTLEFELLVEPQCAPDTQLDSISISVADTQKNLNASDFDGQATIATSITIPHQQVSPLAVEGFCKDSNAGDVPSPDLDIRDAFSANISLRCVGEDKQSIVYTSKSLHLSLRCEDIDSEPETTVDQESSSTSIAR